MAFKDFKPVDPLVRRYRGLVWRIGLMYPFLDVGRFNVQANRGNEYSFDIDEAYYIENSLALSYTHRLFGNVDASVAGSKSTFDYGFTATVAGPRGQIRQCVGRGRL